ncbi:MAG: aminotransferase class V-fold PLP-dependent enzyme, partial [Bacteroidia bacterium]|nr:aminotransferase class V-fold PLP-dependent enzyme [Bacteroidia bacterium]
TGVMTTGGTESILMAVFAAREHARATRPHIRHPEMVVPVSVHPAFEKAAHYFDVVPVRIPLDGDYKADLNRMREAITPNTILLVASAPCYPYGVMDPIAEIGALALEKNLLLHVDACVGGFMLPFIRKAGYEVEAFDFSVPGVTSISADLHKYGYAAKGASVILYKNAELRKRQFFVYTEWPGGIYGSPAMLGTRPGGAIAAAWAVIRRLGEEGYVQIAKAVMETTQKLRAGIEAIEELHIIGNPKMSILAFGSEKLDIYAVSDELTLKGWYMDRQQRPASLHLTVNYAHIAGADDFLRDLRAAVQKVKSRRWASVGRKVYKTAAKTALRIAPRSWITGLAGGKVPTQGRTAAMYGMMGELPDRGDVHELVLHFLDKIVARPPENDPLAQFDSQPSEPAPSSTA